MLSFVVKLICMKNCILLLYLFLFSEATAQHAPVEIMAGHQYFNYQHSIHRKLNTNSKFGWTHITNLMRRYVNHSEKGGRPNEIMNQVYLTTNLSNQFMVMGGLFFTPVTDMKISFAGQYAYRTKTLSLIVNPRFDFGEKFTYELFGLFEFRSAIAPDIHFYGRVQFMTNHSKEGHNRSYQQLRAGVESNKIQFGIGSTFDQYGTKWISTANTGIFIRKIL
jgi:hypothetical protein